MLNSDEKYLILMNNVMVNLMEAHVSYEISDENIIFGKSSWLYLQVFNMMKIHNIDENLFFWWKFITLMKIDSLWNMTENHSKRLVMVKYGHWILTLAFLG